MTTTYTLDEINRLREALRLSKRPHVPRYEPISSCFWSPEAEEIHLRKHNNIASTFHDGLEIELRTLMQAGIRPEEIEQANQARDAELALALQPGSFWRGKPGGIRPAQLVQFAHVTPHGGVQCHAPDGHSRFYQDIYEFSAWYAPAGDAAAEFAKLAEDERARVAAEEDRATRQQMLRDADKAAGRSVGQPVREAVAQHRPPPAPPDPRQAAGLFVFMAIVAAVVLCAGAVSLLRAWGN